MTNLRSVCEAGNGYRAVMNIMVQQSRQELLAHPMELLPVPWT